MELLVASGDIAVLGKMHVHQELTLNPNDI